MDKLKIDRLIIVEGRYDMIKLESIVDAPVIAVNGFGVYNDKELAKTVTALARDRGAIILTDSDSAGYRIRVRLSQLLDGCDVINLFTPEVSGVERRKVSPSAEGFLGVEGIDAKILYDLLSKYTQPPRQQTSQITVADLYELGYTGTPGAAGRKNALLRALGIQSNISNRFLLRILNDRMTKDELASLKI